MLFQLWFGEHAVTPLSIVDTLQNFWGAQKILKYESREWHLQHSENTFCKRLGFQNTVFNGALRYKSLVKH